MEPVKALADVQEVVSMPSRKTLALRRALFVITAVVATVAYAYYLSLQYADIFYEAEFLHVPFIQKALHGGMGFRDVFTSYGEHVFPGYNILLWFNVKLFGFTAAFDTVAGFVAVILTATIVSLSLFSWRHPLAAAGVFVLAASPIHNAMFGMAAAAMVGIVGVALIGRWVGERMTGVRSVTAFAALAGGASIVCIVLFLGGYAIGLIGAVCYVALASVIVERRLDRGMVALVVATLVAFVLYVVVLHRLNAGNGGGLGVLRLGTAVPEIARFAATMAGSAILGKAAHEAGLPVVAYQVVGALLLLGSIVVCALPLFDRAFMRRRGAYTAVFLTAYTLLTIAFVAISRFSNGVDGAMGQWYTAHTSFLPLTLLYVATVRFLPEGGAIPRERGRNLSFGVAVWVAILACGAIGYRADFLKAPFAAAWKKDIIALAPGLLATDGTGNQPESYTVPAMLWDRDVVRQGLRVLYENHLWIFSDTFIGGVSDDGWLSGDVPVSVMCPSGTTAITFVLYRPDGWPPGRLRVNAGDGERDMDIVNGLQRIAVGGRAPMRGLRIDGSAAVFTPPGEQRKLVTIIHDITCQQD